MSWRYDFNHTKSGVVTFGESKPIYSRSMTEREWILGNDVVDELNEYKNLGVVKNYVGSFSSNVDENIEKNEKGLEWFFSADFDRRKAYPLI